MALDGEFDDRENIENGHAFLEARTMLQNQVVAKRKVIYAAIFRKLRKVIYAAFMAGGIAPIFKFFQKVLLLAFLASSYYFLTKFTEITK